MNIFKQNLINYCSVNSPKYDKENISGKNVSAKAFKKTEVIKNIHFIKIYVLRNDVYKLNLILALLRYFYVIQTKIFQKAIYFNITQLSFFGKII